MEAEHVLYVPGLVVAAHEVRVSRPAQLAGQQPAHELAAERAAVHVVPQQQPARRARPVRAPAHALLRARQRRQVAVQVACAIRSHAPPMPPTLTTLKTHTTHTHHARKYLV